MNKLLLVFLLPAIVLIACNKNAPILPNLTSSTYVGEFKRSGPGAEERFAKVSLTFTIDSFSGSSDLGRYPAIGAGTYLKNGSKIHFENTSRWTADFDWSLILNGDFDFSSAGKQISFSRKQYGYTDVYTLVKK